MRTSSSPVNRSRLRAVAAAVSACIVSISACSGALAQPAPAALTAAQAGVEPTERTVTTALLAEPPPHGWTREGSREALPSERSMLTQPKPALLPPSSPPTPPLVNLESGLPRDPRLDQLLAATRKTVSAQHAEQGRRLLAQKQYSQAVIELASAYAYTPEPELLYDLARACRKADLDYEAAAAYQKLLELKPGPPHKQDILDDSKVLLERLDEPDIGVPESIRSHVELAKKGFQSGQFLAAAQQYSVAYTLKTLPRLLFNVAQSYRRAGQMQAAYLIYSRFLEEEPQTPLRKETMGYLTELRGFAFTKPIHKRPWFWAMMGLTAAAVAAGTAGIVLGVQRRDPTTDGGTYTVGFGLSM